MLGVHHDYVWSFSCRLCCSDREARLISQSCNKNLHYWQPAHPTQHRPSCSSYPGMDKVSTCSNCIGILKLSDLDSLTIFMGEGYSGVNFGHPKSEVFRNGGGYSGVNFGHPKSEVFWNGGGGGGAFWSSIPERGFLENLDHEFTVQPETCLCITVVCHILRMWRLIRALRPE